MESGPAAPQLLGRYELVHLLGQGGMGEVHLARIRGAAGFEKLCIVKMIIPQRGGDPQFIDRFLHEARLLVQLTHSNIAQVFDMGDAEGRLFMAIEYVPGVDLSKVEGRAWQIGSQLPVPIALWIGQKVAEALGYAHRKVGQDGAPLGIAHRDVSPQNVMVSYEGEVKVIDFGLAKSAARSKQTLPSTVMGKLGYMSPEQVRGERVDHRTDIYSCGVVIWEMLAGRPMFEMGTMGEMMAQMANPRLPSLASVRPDVTPDLERVLARALAPVAAERYARSDDFARALNEQSVREGLSVGSEEIGTYIRGLCVEEYAEQRKLMSKLSIKSNTSFSSLPAGAGMSGTAIRSPSQSAPMATPAPAANPSTPTVNARPPTDQAMNPGPPRRTLWPLLLLAAVVLLGAGGYVGVHWNDWHVVTNQTAPAVTTVGVNTPLPALPPPAPPPAPAPLPAPAPPPPPAVAAPEPAPPAHPAATEHKRHKKEKTPTVASAKEPSSEAPPQAAPPQATPPQTTPPQSAPPQTAPAQAVALLQAHAKITGASIVQRLHVWNETGANWHHCDLRLPDGRHFISDEIPARDEETVLMTKFSQDGVHVDRPIDHVIVHCTEGAIRVPLN